MIRRAISGLASRAARLGCDRRGVSAVEFALLSPVFGIVLAGTLDLGASAHFQFGLNAAVSAGAQYAITNGTTLSSSTATALADTISKLAADPHATVTGVASVNNGAASTTLNGVTSRAGSTAPADSCYCPTGAAPSVVWGSAMTCGSACPGGGYAGKFVLVTASRPFTSFLGSYGFSPSGVLTTHALVQVQ